MGTFSEIKARVNGLLIDVTSGVTGNINKFVNGAIREAEDRHNFRAMEASVTFVTTSGSHSLGSLPADWKDVRDRPYLREGDNGILGTRMIDVAPDEDAILELYAIEDPNDKGRPAYLLERLTTMEVYPFPDGASQWTGGEYRIVVPYWKYLTDLSADGDTNWFTENMEDYIVYRAAAMGFSQNWDHMNAGIWDARAEHKFLLARRVSKAKRLTKNPEMVPRTGPFRTRLYRR